MTTVCPHCGWPDDQPFRVVSRHTTGRGLTVWVRCACGSVQVREVGAAGARVLSRGRPAPDPDAREYRA
ncbi:hypothetical protein ABZ512_04125 [Nocardiopsis dassonvillei]|uniref:hypothetical protein n=1 Tax=Nocardiopsis dassonvillei TaxID=2014 RepID=UPI0034018A70